MKKAEVEKIIGKDNWEKFLHWMSGQTVGLYSDGETNYYDCDVEDFLELLKSGYDRQQDPLRWD